MTIRNFSPEIIFMGKFIEGNLYFFFSYVFPYFSCSRCTREKKYGDLDKIGDKQKNKVFSISLLLFSVSDKLLFLLMVGWRGAFLGFSNQSIFLCFPSFCKCLDFKQKFWRFFAKLNLIWEMKFWESISCKAGS